MGPLEQAKFLVSAQAQTALEELSQSPLEPSQSPQLLRSLTKVFTPEQARSLLILVSQRQRFCDKFEAAERLFFWEQAGEQASSTALARWRAQRLDQLTPGGEWVELGCGIGGDTLELARYRHVHAFERCEVRLTLARENIRQKGLSERVTFHHGDWLKTKLPEASAYFVDPTRRSGQRRLLRAHQWVPPLETVLAQLPSRIVVKAAPGIKDDELPPQCEVEFVGTGGNCLEAVLWVGLCEPGRRASLRTDRGWKTMRTTAAVPTLAPLSQRGYLLEPDPTAVRSKAVADLAQRHRAWAVDPHLPYLQTAQPVLSEWFQTFAVDAVLSARLKKLRRELRQREIGRLEIKVRGLDLRPETLRPQLKLEGPNSAVLFLFRYGRGKTGLLARRLPNEFDQKDR